MSDTKRNYIVEMLTESNTGRISHKRVISFVSFLMLCIFSMMEYFDRTISFPLLSVFAGLCGGQSVLSIFERMEYKQKINETNTDNQ